MKNLQIGFLVAGQHSTSSPLSSLLGQTASDLASRDRLGGVVGLVLGLVGRDRDGLALHSHALAWRERAGEARGDEVPLGT